MPISHLVIGMLLVSEPVEASGKMVKVLANSESTYRVVEYCTEKGRGGALRCLEDLIDTCLSEDLDLPGHNDGPNYVCAAQAMEAMEELEAPFQDTDRIRMAAQGLEAKRRVNWAASLYEQIGETAGLTRLAGMRYELALESDPGLPRLGNFAESGELAVRAQDVAGIRRAADAIMEDIAAGKGGNTEAQDRKMVDTAADLYTRCDCKDGLIRIGRFHIDEEDYQGAATCFELSGDSEALSELAEIYLKRAGAAGTEFEKKAFNEAKRLFDLAGRPNGIVEVYTQTAQDCMESGRFQCALDNFEMAGDQTGVQAAHLAFAEKLATEGYLYRDLYRAARHFDSAGQPERVDALWRANAAEVIKSLAHIEHRSEMHDALQRMLGIVGSATYCRLARDVFVERTRVLSAQTKSMLEVAAEQNLDLVNLESRQVLLQENMDSVDDFSQHARTACGSETVTAPSR